MSIYDQNDPMVQLLSSYVNNYPAAPQQMTPTGIPSLSPSSVASIMPPTSAPPDMSFAPVAAPAPVDNGPKIFGIPKDAFVRILGTAAQAMSPNSFGGRMGKGAVDLTNYQDEQAMKSQRLGMEQQHYDILDKASQARFAAEQDERAKKEAYGTRVRKLAQDTGLADKIDSASGFPGLGPMMIESLADGQHTLSDVMKLIAKPEKAGSVQAPPQVKAAFGYGPEDDMTIEDAKSLASFAKGSSDKPTGAEADVMYRSLYAKKVLKQSLTPEENAWLQAYERGKTMSADAYGKSRLEIMLKTPQQVYNPEDESTYFTSKGDIVKNPGKYAGAEMGFKVQQKQAIFNEINVASKQVRDAIANPAIKFDQKQVAKFANVLKVDDDGSTIRNFINSDIGKTLTGPEIDYVTGVMSLRESAFGLRNISGMGQGSDMMRAAIAKVVPGATTPNKGYAISQLDRFDTQVKQLSGGLVGLGKGAGKKEAPPGQTPAKEPFDMNAIQAELARRKGKK